MSGIFEYTDNESLGKIIAVDTATVTVRVDDVSRLKRLQVNRLAVLQSSRAGQYLIGLIARITRRSIDTSQDLGDLEGQIQELPENNLVKVTLIGTFLDRDGTRRNIFRRTLETVPEIDANCFALDGSRLTAFMKAISQVEDGSPRLELGSYTIDEDAPAFLNGNKLFQRHAVVVGSTGSGKSVTTARLLDQIATLPSANAILFDIHGEYRTLIGEEFRHIKIAGPADLDTSKSLGDGVLYLPYWLLGYEALVALFVDRSDQNAPNQTMVMSNAVTAAKREFLEKNNEREILANFTIDSPVPFEISKVLDELHRLDTERVPGAREGQDKAGDFNGKLSRLLARLRAKLDDKRLGFMFKPHSECADIKWLEKMAHCIMGSRSGQEDGCGGIKIIDFSEVPSDILPLMVSLLARMIFSVAQWTPAPLRHPLAIFCDEAHLYIPENTRGSSADSIAVDIFERIAKEGRKYGVGLVVISQRPAEVNRTVLSQCNNVIAMRLTNGDDQSVIRKLLPDSLAGIGDILPILDVGEALVVGDASLLPSRIRVAEPRFRPASGTIEFWELWARNTSEADVPSSISAWRRQSLN